MKLPRFLTPVAALAASALVLTGCAGEGASADAETDSTVSLDFATYSVLSLVLKEKGWLEEELGADGVEVEWVFSAGSNKANESLRSEAIDIGTTGGAPAVQARANGTPIKTIALVSATEGFGFIAPKDSSLQSVEDLKGKSIAVTRGTDPYFFALQALDEHGLSESDVTFENLQHADGRTAMTNGSVDAWSGLDPIMAGAEVEDGAKVLYENPSLITPTFLNATEAFLEEQPETAQTVIDGYEKARAWVIENPEETLEIFSDAAGVEGDVAELAFSRLNHGIDPVPSEELNPVLARIGEFMVDSGDVASQADFDEALSTMYDDTFITKADPSAIAGS